MLNPHIQQKILSVLQGYVLSTSMVARKTKLSRITVSKYLTAMQGKNIVQAVRIGKAVAWRTHEHKPLIAIIAKPGTARIAKLVLGEKYSYLLTTNANAIRDAFVLITDNILSAKTAGVPVILIGGDEDNSYCLPELFDTSTLKLLVKKIYYEQHTPAVAANAQIVIEHFEEFEEVVGIHRSEELVKLTARMLRESRVPVKQFERTTFLIEGTIPEETLIDIEQTFHVILAHVYGRMVHPGEQITLEGIAHHVPCLTITLAEHQYEQALER
jgi:hypothetical protein